MTYKKTVQALQAWLVNRGGHASREEAKAFLCELGKVSTVVAAHTLSVAALAKAVAIRGESVTLWAPAPIMGDAMLALADGHTVSMTPAYRGGIEAMQAAYVDYVRVGFTFPGRAAFEKLAAEYQVTINWTGREAVA